MGNPAFAGFKGIGDSRESPDAIRVWVLCGGFLLKGNVAEIVFRCVCWPCLLPTKKAKDIVFRFIIEYIIVA
jgi:hypothetical protein